MADGKITFEVLKPKDPRTGTVTYRVLRDGVELGEVERHAEESWRSMPSGVRYGKRGYYRYWSARVTVDAARAHGDGLKRIVRDSGAYRDPRLYLTAPYPGYGPGTRREVVERLIAWYDEPDRRVGGSSAR